MVTTDNSDLMILNAGSSSLKYTLYKVQSLLQGSLLQGKLLQQESGQLNFTDLADQSISFDENIKQVMAWLTQHNLPTSFIAIGHRVVHGGPKYSTAQIITETILACLEYPKPLQILVKTRHPFGREYAAGLNFLALLWIKPEMISIKGLFQGKKAKSRCGLFQRMKP